MAELNADRALLLNRMQASVKALCSHEQLDQNKLGGIGFCFGGKCVLDLTRADDSLRGVVSFHGLFD